MPHNFFYLRRWVTEAFYKHHIIEVDEDDPWAKKRAELVFQGRCRQDEEDEFEINTLLCLSADQASNLIREINERQAEYRASPRQRFTTWERYVYYERGRKGAAKKRAVQGLGHLKYNVRVEVPDNWFKIHHLAGMVEDAPGQG
jgi:hypothetical protein